MTSPCPQLTAADQAFTQAVAVLRRGDKGMTQTGPRFASWPPAVRDIAAWAADRYGVTVDDLRGRSRAARLVRARQHAFAVASKAGHSLPEIGAYFRRDHKTVHHGVKRHEAIG